MILVLYDSCCHDNVSLSLITSVIKYSTMVNTSIIVTIVTKCSALLHMFMNLLITTRSCINIDFQPFMKFHLERITQIYSTSCFLVRVDSICFEKFNFPVAIVNDFSVTLLNFCREFELVRFQHLIFSSASTIIISVVLSTFCVFSILLFFLFFFLFI
uniref:Uncharacterized protein n=1 Tax=Cacopsylla melanoneura TaxID=428564 RepID=A0A8D8TPU8_9HEMI